MNLTPEKLSVLARAVKRGAKRLDAKLPGWRKLMRRYRHQFDFSSCDHCVIGTIANRDPRLKALREKATFEAFNDGVKFLTRQQNGAQALGFETPDDVIDRTCGDEYGTYRPALEELWRAEFEESR